jgi:hypothetical protein
MDLQGLQEDEEACEAARESNGQRAIYEDVHHQPVPDEMKPTTYIRTYTSEEVRRIRREEYEKGLRIGILTTTAVFLIAFVIFYLL